MTDLAAVEVRVNGQPQQLEVRGSETLIETLRERLGVTSVRGTCGIGICGTCTVLVDGKIVSGCLTLSAGLDGSEIVTSEGLVEDGRLSRVQQAFVDAGAYQCSFCIPGFVLAVHERLSRDARPSMEEMRHQLAGNLCRCGTYPEILDAVAALIGTADEEETT